MGKVADLHHREVQAVIADLVRRLPTEGAVTARVARLRLPVEAWRRAARAAGRQLGRPIRTGVSDTGIVWAELTDWPKMLPEARAEELATRRAIRQLPDLKT